MKRKILKTSLYTIPLLLFLLANSGMAAEPFGTWEYLSSSWDNDAWVVKEKCVASGHEGCTPGEEQSFRKKPQQ
ncbi:hypothetical protein [Roseivirga pacifica]|uniref:hypothetical protein n=1 Tax=Roseivirga pacifica TaxID=1267423 RepID=UPI003BAEE192